MNASFRANLILLTLLIVPQSVVAAPQVAMEPQRLVVTAQEYRITFHRYRSEFRLELRDGRDQWQAVTKSRTQPEFAVVDAQGVHSSLDGPARLRHVVAGQSVVVGLTTVLPSSPPTIARVHLVCTDDGLLIQFAPEGQSGDATPACWAMPRLVLDETVLDAYAYWAASDELHSGRIADLGTPTVYAGVSPWGRQGDTAARLSARHPALLARSESTGLVMGVVFLDYEARWLHAHSFIQAYSRDQLYFYPAIAGRGSITKDAWAWLAPMPADVSAAGKKIERLLDSGKALVAAFEPVAPEPDVQWTKPQPEFPAALRQPQPVEDIRRAIVYTINETIQTDDGLDLARKTGSDVLIRGWFKWGTPPDYARLAPQVTKAHAMGALFGGGITCSALYHGENGLTEQQLLDMATRGPEGQLVNAWNEPRCRHGTLSNPAYLDYLLSSCKHQIDAGADYLFMDEINRETTLDGNPKPRAAVTVRLPVGHEPRTVRVVSPDWAGEQVGTARAASGRLTVTVPVLEAYSVAVLEYNALPEVKVAGRRLVPSWQWGRPARNGFTVHKSGLVPDQWALPGMLQGNLHQHLRNPPTFVVNMPQGGSLRVHVRGVATLGARLQWLVDGKPDKVLELPDRDGKNDAFAREYDQTYELPIPPGRHRLALDNVGGDWACIGWYAFTGETEDP